MAAHKKLKPSNPRPKRQWPDEVHQIVATAGPHCGRAGEIERRWVGNHWTLHLVLREHANGRWVRRPY
jgi:hypothetical protein